MNFSNIKNNKYTILALILLVLAVILLIVLISCIAISNSSVSNKENIASEEFLTLQQKQDTHSWFYFSKDGITEIDLPQNAPKVLKKPWTEAIRISSSTSTNEKAWFSVNKKGLLLLDGSSVPTLIIDEVFFPTNTTDNLMIYEEFPVFHIYKNSIFNEKAIEESRTDTSFENDSFLIQYRNDTGIFYPLLYKSDLGITTNIQISSITFENDIWTLSAKNSTKEKTEFNYYQIASDTPLTQLSNTQRKNAIKTTELSQETFRNKVTPQDFSKAPKRIISLLSVVPTSFPFVISIENTNTTNVSQSIFINYGDSNLGDPLNAYGIIGDTYTMALFPAGTTYFAGALQNKHILKNGKTISFRLPKLPENYSYGTFVVVDSKMYVAWEETSFYETGRAGFIVVDLNKVLYSSEL